MSHQVDVGRTGENIVSTWLSEKGYVTNLNSILPGVTNIEAHGKASKLLIQVRSAAQPTEPSSVPVDQELKIRTLAAIHGFVPWEAKVQLDEKHQIVGKIQWRRLI